MKTETNNKLVIALLSLLFIAPGLLGILFYLNPGWLNKGTSNQGHFVLPATPLPVLKPSAAWSLILWEPNACEARCMKQLDTLARIRIALGRRYYQVHVYLMQNESAPALSAKVTHVLQKYPIKTLHLSAKERNELPFLKESEVFLADLDSYIMMHYALDTRPDAIFHDIKHLLTVNPASDTVDAIKTN